MTKFAKESEGATYYRDDEDRTAWYKQTPTPCRVLCKGKAFQRGDFEIILQA
jgi:hypothetical protein